MQGTRIAGLAIAAGILAGLAGLMPQTAGAISLPTPSEPTYAAGDARAPYGWVDFCRRMPAECAVDTREPDHVRLTPATMRTIEGINRAVNKAIEPITDQLHWGVTESWDLPDDGLGDCEDYVLLKRQRLAAAGIPRRAMRVTVVLDEVNDGHAVLMIRTDRGDLILDNKRDAVLPWSSTGYTFIKRESDVALGWTSLGGARSPVATASRR